MTFVIREYLSEEADLACDVRGLVSLESRERFKKRLGNRWSVDRSLSSFSA